MRDVLRGSSAADRVRCSDAIEMRPCLIFGQAAAPEGRVDVPWHDRLDADRRKFQSQGPGQCLDRPSIAASVDISIMGLRLIHPEKSTIDPRGLIMGRSVLDRLVCNCVSGYPLR